MVQIMPMPCCGAKAPVTTSTIRQVDDPPYNVHIKDTTDWSSFGWDTETGKCKACGADHALYQCRVPDCTARVDLETQLCPSCESTVRWVLKLVENRSVPNIRRELSVFIEMDGEGMMPTEGRYDPCDPYEPLSDEYWK